MKATLRQRLDAFVERFEELSALLAEPEVISDQTRFRDYSREYAELEPLVEAWREYRAVEADIASAEQLLGDADAEMRELAELERDAGRDRLDALEVGLKQLLVPRDPDDRRNVFLEIRAGTGGDEASLFAGDLFRMYSRYAEQHGWKVEVVSASHGEQGGYKEIISRVRGEGVYARLKFESGAHRVQRVPATESQGRIHTSACTVAVMPEADEVGDIAIDPSDLRVDTFRSSGAGGQHVNTTDSAIRITHLPSGVVVECQEERSQHKNRAKAMKMLKSRLYEVYRQQQEAEQEAKAIEKKDISWGNQIRSYVFQPYTMVKDLRTAVETGNVQAVMDGDIDPFIEAFLRQRAGQE